MVGNGQKMVESTYVNGEANGLSTEWDPDGTKRREHTYRDGKKNGPFIGYWTNGIASRLGIT